MKIAMNHESAMIYIDDLKELEGLVNSLRSLNAASSWRVPVIVGDGKRSIQINSLKGFVVTVCVDDFEEWQK